jgi:integrase
MGRTPGSRLKDLPNDWEKFLRQAGIENLRWHDLRHTFSSRLVMNGVDLYTVQKLLGHHSIEMTQRCSPVVRTHAASGEYALPKPPPNFPEGFGEGEELIGSY